MAAWVKNLDPAAKGVILTGCGIVLSGFAYVLYRRIRSNQDDNTDEGFEDVTVMEGQEKRVLVLGLDGAGKSSILAALGKERQPLEVTPTEGFHVIYVETRGMSLNIWEIGGAPHMRRYWRNFIQDTRILVYVVDSSVPTRFEESRRELKQLLSEKLLAGVGIIIIANKQDKNGAKRVHEIQAALEMPDACGMETQVPRSGDQRGIRELRNLLSSLPS